MLFVSIFTKYYLVGVIMRKSRKKHVFRLLQLLDRCYSENQCRNSMRLPDSEFNELVNYLNEKGYLLGVVDSGRCEDQKMYITTWDLRLSPKGEEYILRHNNDKARYWITTSIAILALITAITSILLQILTR